jgi:hypothetical protein
MAVAPLIPLLLSAGGAAYQANAQKQTANYNSKVMQNEATVASAESNQATLTQLRKGNMALGRMTAAGVQSGGGVSGSTGAVLSQSANQAELDALNVRYSGLLRTDSYSDQASLDTAEGKDAAAGSLISGAGGVLRQAYGQKAGTYSATGES